MSEPITQQKNQNIAYTLYHLAFFWYFRVVSTFIFNEIFPQTGISTVFKFSLFGEPSDVPLENKR